MLCRIDNRYNPRIEDVALGVFYSFSCDAMVCGCCIGIVCGCWAMGILLGGVVLGVFHHVGRFAQFAPE